MRKIVAILCAIGATCILGCKTCPPPEIIYTPVEVEVPVYIPPPALEVPPPPALELCADLPTFGDKVRCIGTNITRLERYSTELRIVIESHNAAIPTEE